MFSFLFSRYFILFIFFIFRIPKSNLDDLEIVLFFALFLVPFVYSV